MFLKLHLTGDLFACDVLIKIDLTRLHLLNGGLDHDNWDLTDGNTNIAIIENF